MNPFYVQQRDGFNAGVSGRLAETNPWRSGTVGHAAWSTGYIIGRVSRPAVRAAKFVQMLVVLAVILPWKERSK